MALWKADGTASGKVDWASKPDQLMFRSKVPTWALEKWHTKFKLQLFELSFKPLRWLQTW